MATDELALIRSKAPFLVTLVHSLRKMGLCRSGRDDFNETIESLEELVRFLCAVELDTLASVEEEEGESRAADRKKSFMMLRSETELQELNNLEKQVRAADDSLREAVGRAKLFREEAFAELAEMQRLLNNELVSAQSRIHQDHEQHHEVGNCRPPSPWNFSLGVLLDTHHSELVHPRYMQQESAVPDDAVPADYAAAAVPDDDAAPADYAAAAVPDGSLEEARQEVICAEAGPEEREVREEPPAKVAGNRRGGSKAKRAATAVK